MPTSPSQLRFCPEYQSFTEHFLHEEVSRSLRLTIFKKVVTNISHPHPAHFLPLLYCPLPKGHLQLGPPQSNKCYWFLILACTFTQLQETGCLLGITQILIPEGFAEACCYLSDEHSIWYKTASAKILSWDYLWRTRALYRRVMWLGGSREAGNRTHVVSQLELRTWAWE